MVTFNLPVVHSFHLSPIAALVCTVCLHVVTTCHQYIDDPPNLPPVHLIVVVLRHRCVMTWLCVYDMVVCL